GAVRARRGDAAPAGDTPAHGLGGARANADEGARAAGLPGAQLRTPNADRGRARAPRVWSHPRRLLPAALERDPLALVLAAAAHQLGDGGGRVLAIEEHLVHLLGDRHLDVVAGGECERGDGGRHPLGDRVHLGSDGVELLAAAETLAERAVPAVAARAGRG